MNTYARKARMDDVRDLHRLLMNGASDGSLLPRSLSHLYGHVRDFFVLVAPPATPQGESLADSKDGASLADLKGGESLGSTADVVIGCAALSILWEGAAEIRSLMVHDVANPKANKRLLVQACLEEAASLDIRQVFSLTHHVPFYEELGFASTTKDALPQKIWADCVNCPQFPDCDELAVVITLPMATGPCNTSTGL